MAAGEAGFFAVAEEEIATASGAKVRDKDIFRAKAGGEELQTVGFAEIEEQVLGRGLVAGRTHVEPLDGVGLVTGAEFVEEFGSLSKLREEFGGDFSPDFVAAAAYGRANGGEEIFWIGAEILAHFAGGFLGDAGESALPAGVNGGDGARFGIDEEDGNAVGGLGGE